MKKLAGWLVLVAMILVAAGALADVKVDSVNFPDEVFRNFILDNYVEKGEETLDDEALEEITEMDVSGMKIVSLKGIESFWALETLDCSGNGLTTLDLSSNIELEGLDCSENALQQLTLPYGTTLTTAFLYGNEFKWLDVSGSGALKKLVSKTKPKTVDGHIRYRSDAAELHVDKGVYIAVAFEVLIDETNFPDETFRALVTKYDKNESGSLSKAEINAVTKLKCAKAGIASLKGIEYLTALTTLDCSGNTLRELDLSANRALVTVDCSGNEIEELDTAGLSSLTTLDCSENNLLNLTLVKSVRLTTLDCRGNNLTSLNLTKNKALKTLDCGENALIALSLSTNTELKTLKCDQNKLMQLGLSANGKLKVLWCHQNNLTELNLSKNKEVSHLTVDHNPMISLNIKPVSALVKLVKNQQSQEDAERQCIFYSDGSHDLYCDENLVLVTGSGDQIEIDGNRYELNHTTLTATFLGTKSSAAKKVTIPEKISAYSRSYTVTAIAAGACRGMASLKTVTIGSKIANIGDKAFYECRKVKNVYIKTTKLSASKVGEKAFSGIPDSATYHCPASKLAEYTGLLTDRGASAKSKFVKK